MTTRSAKKNLVGYGIMGNCSTIDQKIDRALRLKELEEQVELLKFDNDQMRKHLVNLQTRSRTVNNVCEQQTSGVSKFEIDAFVEELMANPETNLGFVPDIIERPMIRKILYLVMNALSKVVDTTSVRFLGHELNFSINPQKKDVDAVEVEAPDAVEAAGQRLVESPKVYDFRKLSESLVEREPLIQVESRSPRVAYSPDSIGAFFEISTVVVNAGKE